MNKSVNTVLVLIFSSLGMGLYAQCDSMKSFDLERATEVNISLDPKDYPPTADDPTNPPQPPNPTEVRRIYFIHGLGGDKSAWSRAGMACAVGAPNFPARECQVTYEDYTSSLDSLYLAASDVRDEIFKQANEDRKVGINLSPPKPYYLNPARAIIIAHSQGGLVTRELMHLDLVQPGTSGTGHSTLTFGMNYGGVVMVASSLQGAQILNNRDYILAWAKDGCDKLLDGPKDQLAGSILPVATIKSIISKKLQPVMETVCDVAANDILPMFFNTFYQGITNSYTVGASYIDTLNKDTLNPQYKAFPKMAFYAIEPQENIFWRTMRWMITEPNNVDSAFAANDDWHLLDSTILPLIAKYQVKAATHLAEHNRLRTLCNIPIVGMFYARKWSNEGVAYNAWNRGLEWFNQANYNWKVIIGAATKNGSTITYKTENDGVVLAESASKLPKATHAPVEIYPNKNSTRDVNKGSSHMQVRNDEGIREHLKKLFDGGYQWWFRVEERP